MTAMCPLPPMLCSKDTLQICFDKTLAVHTCLQHHLRVHRQLFHASVRDACARRQDSFFTLQAAALSHQLDNLINKQHQRMTTILRIQYPDLLQATTTEATRRYLRAISKDAQRDVTEMLESLERMGFVTPSRQPA